MTSARWPLPSRPSRRTLLLSFVDFAVLVLAGRRVAASSSVALGPASDLDLALLEALAAVVLPSDLGADGCRRVVRGYLAWLDGYAPGVELLPLEDSAFLSELPFARPATAAATNPKASYDAQLRALDRRAEEEHGARFALLPPVAQKALVRKTLEQAVAEMRLTPLNLVGDPAIWLPGPAAFAGAPGDHVALSLMAFYFNGREALNRSLGAAVDARTCRGFAGVAKPPRRLGP